MKYFIALDKGDKLSANERYIKLSLKNINEKLEVNNNLKALCTFTMSFNNIYELKDLLVAKKVLPKGQIYYKLVIIYSSTGKQISIPFKSDEKYFDLNNLIKILKEKCQNKNFFEAFLNRFRNNKYMPETFFELSECLTNPKPTYILEDRIQSFVYSLCYKKYEGKESFSYKSLCDIAMFVAQNDKPKEEVKEHISHKPKQEEIKRPLGEVEQFEKEWLEHRAAMRNEAKLEDDDGQIRLY